MATLPKCEKCGQEVDSELRCKPCRREHTWLWVKLRQRGER